MKLSEHLKLNPPPPPKADAHLVATRHFVEDWLLSKMKVPPKIHTPHQHGSVRGRPHRIIHIPERR